MTFDPDELKDAILAQDDFGHEMRVGSLLCKAGGYQTKYGGTYSDPVTHKPRQYDFRTTIDLGGKSVMMAIECKNLSHHSPMVVCGRDRTDDESFHYLVESRNGSFQHRSLQVYGKSAISLCVSGSESLYPPRSFVGKSIVRLKKDNKGITALPDSDIHDRWSQALASATGLVEDASRLADKSGSSKHQVAILPVVVIPDDTLWTAYYSNDGTLDSAPIQVKKAELYLSTKMRYGWEKLNTHYVFSHIHFFTLSGFNHFLGWIANNTHSHDRLFNEHAREI